MSKVNLNMWAKKLDMVKLSYLYVKNDSVNAALDIFWKCLLFGHTLY